MKKNLLRMIVLAVLCLVGTSAVGKATVSTPRAVSFGPIPYCPPICTLPTGGNVHGTP